MHLTTLQDVTSQLDDLKARLAATERALQEANQRSSEMNSRMALKDTDARLKVQDLVTQLSAAEDLQRLSNASHKEAVDSLERELREARVEIARMQSDEEKIRRERMQAVSEVWQG